SDTDLELGQTAQGVDLVDDHFGQTVNANGIACDDCVEPTGTACTAGDRTELAAGVADVVAGLVEQLGREGTLADAGGVALEDAHDIGDGRGANTRTDAAAAGNRMGRSNIGIGTHVEVKQRTLSALKQNELAVLDGLVG